MRRTAFAQSDKCQHSIHDPRGSHSLEKRERSHTPLSWLLSLFRALGFVGGRKWVSKGTNRPARLVFRCSDSWGSVSGNQDDGVQMREIFTFSGPSPVLPPARHDILVANEKELIGKDKQPPQVGVNASKKNITVCTPPPELV